MKVFWISLLLFAILLTTTAINAVYIHKTVGEMQRLLGDMALTENRTDQIHALEELWQNHRQRIGLTVGIREVNAIERGLIELKWADAAKEEEAFQAKRSLLYAEMSELIRQESLGANAVF